MGGNGWVLGTPRAEASLDVCPAAPVLYPNLAELESYMGLALSSEEIQKNLEDTLVGGRAGGCPLPVPGPPPPMPHQ